MKTEKKLYRSLEFLLWTVAIILINYNLRRKAIVINLCTLLGARAYSLRLCMK